MRLLTQTAERTMSLFSEPTALASFEELIESLDSFVDENKARLLSIPGSSAVHYEPMPGYQFLVGCWYYGSCPDHIEITESGTIICHNENSLSILEADVLDVNPIRCELLD